jgi:phosphoglycolate phosphatase-like HAD superfamily hydrolase
MSAPVVLFDVDGTLTDTNYYLHTLAWRRAFLDHGHDVGSWRIHRLIGASSSTLMSECIGYADDGVKASWRSHFDELIPDVRPFPGARELVTVVSERGAKAVFATSSPSDLVEHHLRALELESDDLDAVTTDTDVEEAKPSPEVFRSALESVGAAPADGLVIGDTGWDLDAASAAGLPAIAVRSGGWTEPELLARGAVEVHDDVSVLLGSIEASALGDHLRSG